MKLFFAHAALYLVLLTVPTSAAAGVVSCPAATTLEELGACYRTHFINARTDPTPTVPTSVSEYVAPTDDERVALKSVVAAMLRGGDLSKITLPPIIGDRMALDELVDAENGSTYWYLYEFQLKDGTTALEKGWGMFVTRSTPARELAVFAVHPLFDTETDAQALAVFKGVDARAVFVAGADRRAARTGDCMSVTTASYNTEADAAHNLSAFAQAATEALVEYYGTRPWSMLQFHGMGADSCPSSDVMLANGINRRVSETDPLSLFALNVNAANPSWSVALPAGSCSFNGTHNVQGRLLNGVAAHEVCDTAAANATGRFIQIEQHADYRQAALWIEPIMTTWPVPQVPAAPAELTATLGDSRASLRWTASPGATSYNVKRATTSGGPYTTVQTGVATASFVDSGLSNGTTYYFVVSALNPSGESADSGEVAVTPLVITYTITASAGPNGTISPSGPVLVDAGASQSFVFVPGANHGIDAVTVDGAVVSNPTNPYTFTGVAASHTISVSFRTVPADTNVAAAGAGYSWSTNTTATSNDHRVAKSGVRDGNLKTTVSVNGGAFDQANAWEAVGVIWPTARTVSSVSFINGTLSTGGHGFFDASCTLQYTLNGTTWLESGWTALGPAYPYNSSAASQTYTLSGPPLSSVRGVRISGQVATHGTRPSRYFRYKEVLVYGH